MSHSPHLKIIFRLWLHSSSKEDLLQFILERCSTSQDILDAIPGGGTVWQLLGNSLFPSYQGTNINTKY